MSSSLFPSPLPKKPKDLVAHVVNKIKNMPIVATDIGIVHMAGCRYINDDTMPIADTTDLHYTRDGRYYRDCTEGRLVEIAYNWIGERWNTHFKGVGFIGIEKQLTRMKSDEERACIDINMILHAMFYLMHMMYGGPLVLVITPEEWKTLAGIEIGGNNQEPTPSRVINGVFYQSEINKDHARNKKRSVDRFLALTHVCPAIDALSKRIPRPSVDEMEATMFAKVIHDNLERFVARAIEYRHHNQVLGWSGNMRTIDKMIPLPRWDNYVVDPMPSQPKIDNFITSNKKRDREEEMEEKKPKKPRKKNTSIVIEESDD